MTPDLLPDSATWISTDAECLRWDWLIDALHIEGVYLQTPQETVKEAFAQSLCFGLYPVDAWTPGPEGPPAPQLGFARVVTDGVLFSAILDVVIDERIRGRGLGERLMGAVLGHPKVRGTNVTLHALEATGFYLKLGFTPSENFSMTRPAPKIFKSTQGADELARRYIVSPQ